MVARQVVQGLHIAGIAFLSVLFVFVALFAPAPAFAQDSDCPSEDEITAAASAIIVGTIIDVRTGGSSTAGNESGDDSFVVEVVGIEKGGAQNPLAVYYPGEDLPDLAADVELNIVLSYSLDSARAESSLTCGYTTYTNGDAIKDGSASQGTLGETAGETLTEAVRSVGLAGATVLAVTFIWRIFREFRPRLS